MVKSQLLPEFASALGSKIPDHAENMKIFMESCLPAALMQPGQPPGELWSINGAPECSALGKNGRAFISLLQTVSGRGPAQKGGAIGPVLSAVDANSERATGLVASPSLDLDASGTSSRLPLQHAVSASWLLGSQELVTLNGHMAFHCFSYPN